LTTTLPAGHISLDRPSWRLHTSLTHSLSHPPTVDDTASGLHGEADATPIAAQTQNTRLQTKLGRHRPLTTQLLRNIQAKRRTIRRTKSYGSSPVLPTRTCMWHSVCSPKRNATSLAAWWWSLQCRCHGL